MATIATPRGKSNTTILVFSDARVLGAPKMVPNTPSSWSTSGRALVADLVIVTNAAFAAEADRLAGVRNAGSVATLVVDVDDVYDEYGFGVRSPQAIRDFLLASARWKKAPRFVLLVGDATSDPRNYLATGSNDFIPNRLVLTTALRTASDDEPDVRLQVRFCGSWGRATSPGDPTPMSGPACATNARMR